MGQLATDSTSPGATSRGVTRNGVRTEGYVGLRALEAAQAVRRVGLKPALERSLGWGAEHVGQVVEQEPGEGAELARNSMVKLYVGAPGEDAFKDAGTRPQSHEQGAREAERTGEPTGRSLRRKPGLAPLRAVDPLPPPPPRMPEPASDAEPETEERRAVGAPKPGQLATRANEMFAERRARRRGRPEASRISHPRGWRRSRLAKVAAVALALWLAVGLASAFSSHGGRQNASGAVHQSAGAGRETKPLTPQQPEMASARPSPGKAKQRRSRVPRRSRQRRAHARGARTGSARPRTRQSVLPAPVAAGQAPVPERRGGPFSP